VKTQLIAALAAGVAAAAQAGMTIDSFDSRQYIFADRVYGTTNSGFIATSEAEVVGGERDMCVRHVDGAVGALMGDVACVFPNAASLSCGLRVMGCLGLVYDGPDASSNIDPTGLNGIDLTAGGTSYAFKFGLVSDLGADLAITVFTDATHYSMAWQTIPTDPTFNFVTTYAGFSQFFPVGPDGGADFRNVGAIAFLLCNGPGGADISIGEIVTVDDPRFGAGSIGYWGAHPDAWPVESLALGSLTYGSNELLAFLNQPNRGDASLNLAKQLIGAKFNILRGSDPESIGDAVALADQLLALYPGQLPFDIPKKDPNRALMVAVAQQLDEFNAPPFLNGDVVLTTTTDRPGKKPAKR